MLDELAANERPRSVGEYVWAGATAAERARQLWQARKNQPFPAHVDRLLRRLPSWIFCSPEDGYPHEWFDVQGLLLPHFRPDGERREVFEALRWQIDRRRRLTARMVRRWRARWRAVACSVEIFVWLVAFLLFLVPLAAPPPGEELAALLTWLFGATVTAGFWLRVARFLSIRLGWEAMVLEWSAAVAAWRQVRREARARA